MTIPSETAPPPLVGDTASSVDTLAPPVIVGPIAVSSLDGIPLTAIVGPIHHFSGKRLRAMIMRAFSNAELTIDIPE